MPMLHISTALADVVISIYDLGQYIGLFTAIITQECVQIVISPQNTSCYGRRQLSNLFDEADTQRQLGILLIYGLLSWIVVYLE